MPFSIAVAGAGPAGLASALLLARDGHAVRVFERFEQAGPVGSGFMLQPTGLAVLDHLDLLTPILALGSRIERLEGHDAASGRRVLDVRYDFLRGGRFGLGIHRAALFSVLSAAAEREGLQIETGFEACSICERRLVARDGRREGPFDLVVDASGARSLLRAAGAAAPRIRPLHYGAFWTTLPFMADGFAADALQQRYRRASIMAGILPIGLSAPGGAPLAAFFWSCRADRRHALLASGLASWKAEVHAVWPALAPYLDRIESFDQMTFAAYAHHTMRRPAGERYAAIGDAAHQTSPQLGQGVNMALLDAFALARALRDGPGLAAALDRYCAERRAHVRLYQSLSLLLTPFYQSDSRLIPLLRDTLVPVLARVPPAPAVLASLVAGCIGDPLGRLGLAEPHWAALS